MSSRVQSRGYANETLILYSERAVSTLDHRLPLDLMLVAGIFCLVLGVPMLLLFGCEWLGASNAEIMGSRAGKLDAVEGLRGVLALSVVAHHAYCWYYYTQTAVWGTAGSIIFERLPAFGVMQFFFISGFLFWRKLATRPIEFRAFYLSRLLRIGPVYYACVGSATLIGLSLTHFHLTVAPDQFVGSLASWLLFCVTGQQVAVNGVDIARIVCGVVWTLALEWWFYLSLPFLEWFSRKSWRLVPLGVLCGVTFVICKHLTQPDADDGALNLILLQVRIFAKFMLIGFGGGILVATFAESLNRRLRLSGTRRACLLVVLYAGFFLIPDFPGSVILGWLCLLIGFALVVQGTDLFGFLTSRPVRFLGIISYDLYLLHGIVFYLAMRARGGIHPVTPGGYMLQTAGCLIVIVLLAAAMHLLIERPAMALSERLARPAERPRRVNA